MMRLIIGAILTVGLGFGAAMTGADDAYGADAKKPLTIADVMKKAHKKPNELLKKVATGSATDAQKKELVTLYKALAAAKPAKGSAASWKEKTDLLVAAAQAAVEGKEDAPRRLASASNCMTCHRAHK